MFVEHRLDGTAVKTAASTLDLCFPAITGMAICNTGGRSY